MLRIFKSYGDRPFSVGKLSQDKLSLIKRSKHLSCGIDKHQWLFSVQEFFFSKLVEASCRLHDIYYLMRGNLLDKCKGDYHFLAKMTKDMFNTSIHFVMKRKALLNRVVACLFAPFYFLFLEAWAIIYFLAVFTVGLFVFEYGEYRKWPEIEKYLKTGRI